MRPYDGLAGRRPAVLACAAVNPTAQARSSSSHRRPERSTAFPTPSPRPSRRSRQPNAKTISPAPDTRQPKCRTL